MVGPALTPSARRIILRPSALPRSAAGKERVIMATLTQRMAAAPKPWKQRAAMSVPNDGRGSAERRAECEKP